MPHADSEITEGGDIQLNLFNERGDAVLELFLHLTRPNL